MFADFHVSFKSQNNSGAHLAAFAHLMGYPGDWMFTSQFVRMTSVRHDNSKLISLGFLKALPSFCPSKNKNVEHKIQL